MSSPGALDHEWKTTSCNRFLVLFSASKAASKDDWMTTHFAKGANMDKDLLESMSQCYESSQLVRVCVLLFGTTS